MSLLTTIGATVTPVVPQNPSAVVSGAGSPGVDGTYPYVDQLNGRGRWQRVVGMTTYEIFWEGVWRLGEGSQYLSEDDVAFPWLATFVVDGGDEPAPTVTHT